MDSFTVGDIVVVAFPYADFSKFKNRPALIVGQAEFGNLILCQITSKAETSKQAITLNDSDFAKGSLSLRSYIRPDKIFTIEPSVARQTVGKLKNPKVTAVQSSIRQLFT